MGCPTVTSTLTLNILFITSALSPCRPVNGFWLFAIGISLKLLELFDLEVLDLNVLDSDGFDLDVLDLEVPLFNGFSRTRPSSFCAALLKILNKCNPVEGCKLPSSSQCYQQCELMMRHVLRLLCTLCSTFYSISVYREVLKALYRKSYLGHEPCFSVSHLPLPLPRRC